MIKNITVTLLFVLVIILGYITYVFYFNYYYTPETLSFHIYKDGFVLLNDKNYSIDNIDNIWDEESTNELAMYMNYRYKKYGTENVIIECESDISLTNLHRCIELAKLTRALFMGIKREDNVLDFTFDQGSSAMSETVFQQYQPYEKKIIYILEDNYVLYENIFDIEEVSHILGYTDYTAKSYNSMKKICTKNCLQNCLNGDNPFSLQIVCSQKVLFSDLAYLLDICEKTHNIDQLFILFM